jgi:hypothetical protein
MQMKNIKTFLIIIFVLTSLIISQDTIKEEMDVEWWVIPLFAVDKSGHSVTNLKKRDVSLFVNKKEIKDFSLYRKEFYTLHKETKKKPLKKTVYQRENLILLLFDNALSAYYSIVRAKAIAKRIIIKSKKGTRFIVMTIDPFSGLTYISGPESDKNSLITAITKSVKKKSNYRIPPIGEVVNNFLVEGGGKKAGFKEMKYGAFNLTHFLRTAGRMANPKLTNFFMSFQYLYSVLSSFDANKFIYLFSEGISEAQMRSDRTNIPIYYQKLAQAATYLSRSGAVLFLMNPMGVEDSIGSTTSGEQSLIYMASESGGQYIEGNKEKIVEKIENMHRAYYEIAFSDPDNIEGNIRNIKIQSKKKKITIHTLTTLEKQKQYPEMNELEKELYTLNLVNKNPLFKLKTDCWDIHYTSVSEYHQGLKFEVKISETFLSTLLDLFKVYVHNLTREVTIEKESIRLTNISNIITIPNKKDHESYFALINSKNGSARIYGMKSYGLKPDKSRSIQDSRNNNGQLEELLLGVGEYCNRLKEESIHYFCEENIIETRDCLGYGYGTIVDDISKYEDRASVLNMLKRFKNTASTKPRHVKKFQLDYQLINNKGRITERRRIISEKTEKEFKDIKNRIKSFLVKGAYFGPLTMVSEENQNKYNYRLINYDKINGKKCAIIEAIPKNKSTTKTVYGKIWIDLDDYSVHNIEANPESVRGYEKMYNFARKLMSKLVLTLKIEYKKVRQGLRYPTRVIIRELYKGGPVIIKHEGGKGWEKNKTEYIYKNYRFFEVDTEVQES